MMKYADLKYFTILYLLMQIMKSSALTKKI